MSICALIRIWLRFKLDEIVVDAYNPRATHELDLNYAGIFSARMVVGHRRPLRMPSRPRACTNCSMVHHATRVDLLLSCFHTFRALLPMHA
jgi:hypothetical protein